MAKNRNDNSPKRIKKYSFGELFTPSSMSSRDSHEPMRRLHKGFLDTLIVKGRDTHAAPYFRLCFDSTILCGEQYQQFHPKC